jgi:hypothetical protein
MPVYFGSLMALILFVKLNIVNNRWEKFHEWHKMSSAGRGRGGFNIQPGLVRREKDIAA